MPKRKGALPLCPFRAFTPEYLGRKHGIMEDRLTTQLEETSIVEIVPGARETGEREAAQK